MERSRQPGLHDVARLAGVSHQTVSRVVNGAPNTAAATRERVEAAIVELGYRPNLSARALVTNRSHLIGIIAADAELFGPSGTQQAVERAARDEGYFCGAVRLREVTDDAVDEATAYLMAQQVAGMVVVAGERDAIARVRAHDSGVPLVVVQGDLSGAVDAVGVDSYRGGLDATRHLVDLGHRVVAHVAGPSTWGEAEARSAGWRSALEQADLPPGPLVEGDWTAAGGYAAGRRLAATGATGVFVANDQMAIGVLRALDEAGRRAPEDVSVVGFDDIPEGAFLSPPLTTVRQDFDAVGRAAVAMLTEAIGGSVRPQELIVPRLVIRDSTGPAPLH